MSTPAQMIAYFDQNKWIELARMLHGRETGERADRVKSEILAAVDSGALIVPLSSINYMEMARIKDSGRRARLGEAMWRVSKGYTLASHSDIVRHELSRALRKHFPQVAERGLKLIGRGVNFAFGQPEPSGIVAIFSDVVERALLCGNDALETESIAFQNRQHQATFQNHLRDLRQKVMSLEAEKREDVLFAMLLVDIRNPLAEVVEPYGIGPQEFFAKGLDTVRSIILDMPTRKLDYHLHKLVVANPQYNAKLTDLEDWAGVGVAANYCHVVICEKHMADMIRRAKDPVKARIETKIDDLFISAA